MPRRNHASKRKRIRAFKRRSVMATERCATCRRRLDPHFTYDRTMRPHCSRHGR